MLANCASSVAACSAFMSVAMSRPDTTRENSSSSSMEKPSCAPSAWMSRIWSALTALVLENSMADSLSWRYCSSVPSTVLRTPVRDVSILTAAAPVATATPAMAAVTGTSFCPAASILAPVLYISPPALASLEPLLTSLPPAVSRLPLAATAFLDRLSRRRSAFSSAEPL